ncbi:hypothetical protein PT974_04500 [Cladobotryum mycophilum]|uniref:Methyltransferase domain-containing protein n=1 Tax=Cladobotryum mycophilum TaxID=491253 RepID=A0ABR0SV99_9HYPO
MSGYNAVFMYSSSLCVPVPLDRYSRPKPEKRDRPRQRPVSYSQASQTFSRHSVLRRSRSSSGTNHASRCSSETPGTTTGSSTTSTSSASTGGRGAITGAVISPGPLTGTSKNGPSTDTGSSTGAGTGTGTGILLQQHCNGPAAATTSATSTPATTSTIDAAAVGHKNLSVSHSQTQTHTLTSSKASSPSTTTTTSTSTSTSISNTTTNHSTNINTTTNSNLSRSPPRAAAHHHRLSSRMHFARPNDGLFSLDLRHALHPDQDAGKSSTYRQMNGFINRPESISSTSGNTSVSARTMNSSDPSAAGDNGTARPFVQRNGRTYLSDPTNPYPLPTDLTELHRQTLRTLLLIQVFGAPVASQSLTKKPPMRVLEIGCGSGFWSMMCHQYYKGRGHSGISFTGIDIAPLAPDSNSSIGIEAMKPDSDMKWKFIQHDLRQTPWPLPSEEYDLIMTKDMSLAVTNMDQQRFIDEYVRLLRPGGTLEVWESDHLIRMLKPHIPAAVSSDDADEQLAASSLGCYVMNANTPLSGPLNPFLGEYNQWITRALENRNLNPVPCTLIGPVLLQESEALTDVRSRRMAIPLSELRWEREGVGGVITKDGKPIFESRGKELGPKMERKTLTAGQIALRQTAMLTVVQQAQSMEPLLREVSGKSQDEWDAWLGKMMGDLMNEGGASWGECLEIGAWSAKKKKRT